MKTNRYAQSEEISQRIERFCRGHFALYAVLICLLLALTKMDSSLLRTMQASYGRDFGLISEYAREEPTRTPPTIGSEIRLITVSGA